MRVADYRPKVFASTRNVSREEWLRLRQHGIGGSDAGAIIGVSAFANVFDVWLSKTSPINAERDEPTERMQWGNLLEPVIVQEFARRTGFRVRELPLMLQHPDYPWMLANVDGLIRTPEGKGILEVKNVGASRWSDWADGRVPPMYMAQVQHYLAVTGYNHAYFAVLVGGQELVITRVGRDEEFIRKLIEAESDFWVSVELGEPPALQPGESAKNYLLDKYPVAVRAEPINLPLSALALVEQYQEAHETMEQAKLRKEEAQLLLCDLLGDAESGIVGSHSVNWRNSKKTTFDRKALAEIYPAISEEFTVRGTTRRFTITPFKG